jgi:hypothetical protein
MGYQITRPDADQLRFNSSANGPVVLDDYLEAVELGGRTLAALLLDLFNGSGVLRTLATPAEVTSAINAAIAAAASQIAAAASQVAANDSAIAAAASATSIAGGPVTSVAGKNGVVTLTKGDVGLGSVDNTSDAGKPVSSAGQTALNLKADLTSNTFSGAQILSDQQVSRAMLKDNGMVFVDKGASGASTQTIDYSAGSHQKLTITGLVTMNAVTNWPPTGNTGEVLLELVNGAAFLISWTMAGTTQKWWKSDGTSVSTIGASGVTLQASGTDWILMWSTDAGTTTNFKVMR